MSKRPALKHITRKPGETDADLRDRMKAERLEFASRNIRYAVGKLKGVKRGGRSNFLDRKVPGLMVLLTDGIDALIDEQLAAEGLNKKDFPAVKVKKVAQFVSSLPIDVVEVIAEFKDRSMWSRYTVGDIVTAAQDILIDRKILGS